MANKREIAKRILNNLSNLDSGVADVYKSIDAEVSDLADKLKKATELKTVAEASAQFKKLQSALQALIPSINSKLEEVKKILSKQDQDILNTLKTRLSEVSAQLSDTQQASDVERQGEIADLKAQIQEVAGRKIKLPDFTPQINELGKRLEKLIKDQGTLIPSKKDVESALTDIKSFRTELSKPRGGGSAHLQVNANSSVVSSRYTDINFVSNTAILWSASDDNTNRRVNIVASLISGGAGGSSLTVKEVDGAPSVNNVNTIVVSNGTLTDDGGGQVTVSTGGGGSGITRTSSIISVSSTFGATAQTDYVAIANVGISLTLPTAVGNTNLYTIKNVSASSVLVATTSAQTIDGSSTALIPNNYESLSFISDNGNWNVI